MSAKNPGKKHHRARWKRDPYYPNNRQNVVGLQGLGDVELGTRADETGQEVEGKNRARTSISADLSSSVMNLCKAMTTDCPAQIWVDTRQPRRGLHKEKGGFPVRLALTSPLVT